MNDCNKQEFLDLYNKWHSSYIFSAFGCGVFGNNPNKVAIMFKSLLRNYKFRKVIFAIPNNGNGNYEAFKKVFNE